MYICVLAGHVLEWLLCCDGSSTMVDVVVDVGLQFTTTLKLKYLIDDTLTRCSLDPKSPLVDLVGDSSYGDSDRPTLRELGRASQFRRVVAILPCSDKPRTESFCMRG